MDGTWLFKSKHTFFDLVTMKNCFQTQNFFQNNWKKFWWLELPKFKKILVEILTNIQNVISVFYRIIPSIGSSLHQSNFTKWRLDHWWFYSNHYRGQFFWWPTGNNYFVHRNCDLKSWFSFFFSGKTSEKICESIFQVII